MQPTGRQDHRSFGRPPTGDQRYGWSLESEGDAEDAAARLAAARVIFEELRATWWLERMDGARQERTAIG
jgi:hypothetical protein